MLAIVPYVPTIVSWQESTQADTNAMNNSHPGFYPMLVICLIGLIYLMYAIIMEFKK